ncbi:hypothetical protein CROQUDRAFT_667702 [Cronartium quercuum f. sp. fusiforme G11]|uniref:Lysophospholipase NTE1 n=1 Tax=Cronartium quercuum f. sp. fusiforme G11 TaxID=708437 RepID=A0A9P6NTG5_9BASI|nr:hypothetical protein CROQUDRAFT_667702 [Cronartium quercuum f. sp. fusiforme G11]
MFNYLLSLCLSFLSIITISLPKKLFEILHWSGFISVQINFQKLLILFILLTFISSWTYKLKVLNRYSTLPKTTPLNNSNQSKSDLKPEQLSINDENSPHNEFHNYLDEFLSAIRVFGFLEKPVFHELARHLQTRRLIAGDTLSLDEDKSFYIVIDGSVQVFARPVDNSIDLNRVFERCKNTHSHPLAYDDEDDNGFQLLNVVGPGGTLSSLFTILSLFTEDVKLRYEDEKREEGEEEEEGIEEEIEIEIEEEEEEIRSNEFVQSNVNEYRSNPERSSTLKPFSPQTNIRNSSLDPDLSSTQTDSMEHQKEGENEGIEDKEKQEDDDDEDGRSTKTSRRSLSTSKPHRANTPSHSPYRSTVEPLYDEPDSTGRPPCESSYTRSRYPTNDSRSSRPRNKTRSTAERVGAQPRESTIARATTDTTLAVIPSEAFKRLTSKFPNSVAHILQVILTRLQRVTFLTSHQYLGLTKELLRTEKAFNELACYPLPDTFYQQGGMIRLRQSFLPQTKLVDEPNNNNSKMNSPNFPNDYFGLIIDQSRNSFNPLSDHQSFGSSNQNHLHKVALKLKTDITHHKPEIKSTDSKPQKQSAMAFDISNTTNHSINHLNEDLSLRQTVMNCIAKSIGLVQHSHRNNNTTINHPPNLSSPEPSIQQRPSFKSGLGSLSYLKTLDQSTSTSASIIEEEEEEEEELPNEVEILYFPKDSILVKAGERHAGLYYVIDGFLDVFMDSNNENNDKEQQTTTNKKTNKRKSFIPSPLSTENDEKGPIKLFSIKPGGIAGYLASISGFTSYVDIRAKTDVYVGFLPARALESIMDRRPIVLLTLAKRLISLLSPLVLHIDSALEWMAVDAGQIIYREGDPSDNLYIVIGGRLRSINEKETGRLEIVSEYGQGESIGELDCITNSSRRSTLHAIRDSELVRIPMTLFNAISIRHPAITIQVSRLIASRVRKELDSSRSSSLKTITDVTNKTQSNFNLKTVAIIPNTKDVPVIAFATALHSALENLNAKTQLLNQSVILSVLGRHAFSRLGKLKLTGWLAELEQSFRIVLYVADTAVGAPWTQTCIRQADYILVVCDGGSQADLGEYERLLVGMKTTARKELVLLHPDRNVPAGSTRPWLKNRPWIHAHHHVELAGATPLADNHLDELLPVTALRQLRDRVKIQLSKYRRRLPAEPRLSSNNSTDFARLARRLCGKSIAVVLGGGGARGISHIGVLRALIESGIPIDMIGGTSIGSFIGGLYARNSDLLSTLGRAKTFSGRMDSLWRIITDITYPVVAYTTGHEFNRGIYKCFYDYHIEVSVMLRMGADSVFAVDVGSIDDTSPRNFPESVSGWWLLLNRLNPWSSADSVPTMTDIQSRLTYVSSVKTLEEAKATPGVLYMRMPVTQYTTMDFGKFEEIYQKGYEAAKEMLKEWADQGPGKLPDGLERSGGEGLGGTGRGGRGSRGAERRRRLMVRRNSV